MNLLCNINPTSAIVSVHAHCLHSSSYRSGLPQSEMRICLQCIPFATATNGAAEQVVPSVPNLYKNSFTYHSVSCVPADFQECGNFLGARSCLLRMLCALSRTHSELQVVGEGHMTTAICSAQTQPSSPTQRCWCTA